MLVQMAGSKVPWTLSTVLNPEPEPQLHPKHTLLPPRTRNLQP
jgi:hypothetical protein